MTNVNLKLLSCKDLSCIRTDHLYCPVSRCSEILHSNLIVRLYRCNAIICNEWQCHTYCPACYVMLHVELKMI